MKIRHAAVPGVGQTIENTFVAYSDVELEIGSADVVETSYDTLFPSRPHHIQVRTQCDESAVFALFGAATTRALILARQQAGTPSRIYTEVEPGDEALIEVLATLGYKDDDGLMRLSKELKKGAVVAPLPRGCVAVKDYLIDEIESKFFIERYNAMFSADMDDEWLEEIKQKPGFCRFLIVAEDGLAGELLAWTDEMQGVIGVIQTAPSWQRKGIATYLVDLARQYFADRGLGTMYFDVWKRLGGARRLAAATGFRPVNWLKKYPGINVDA